MTLKCFLLGLLYLFACKQLNAQLEGRYSYLWGTGSMHLYFNSEGTLRYERNTDTRETYALGKYVIKSDTLLINFDFDKDSNEGSGSWFYVDSSAFKDIVNARVSIRLYNTDTKIPVKHAAVTLSNVEKGIAIHKQLVDTNALFIEVKRKKMPFKLTIDAAGYLPYEQTISPRKNLNYKIYLKRANYEAMSFHTQWTYRIIKNEDNQLTLQDLSDQTILTLKKY